MKIEHIDAENIDAVIAFLDKEGQDLSTWTSTLKQGLFRVCVINEENNAIECVFIFEDHPRSLVQQHEFMTKTNWTQWLKNHFEVPNETYHMLWLTQWHIITARKFDVDCMSLVLSSLFISNFEVESILLGIDKADSSEEEKSGDDKKAVFNFAFQMLFHPLHRIHRKADSANSAEASLSEQIDMFYCPASKNLPAIEIRKATVEDFDDLMPLFEQNSGYLQRKHGEFFLAELIESAQNDARLKTLVALSKASGKPVGFVCFTTNIDMASLRNCFYLDPFDDFEAVDYPAESHKYNQRIELRKQKSKKVFDRDTLFSMVEQNHDFAEHIAGCVMKCYTNKGWMLLQEELLNQAPESDHAYVAFIKMAYEVLNEDRAEQLQDFINEEIIDYRQNNPHYDAALFDEVDTESPTETATASRPATGTGGGGGLHVDTDLDAVEQKEALVVLISLLCIDPNYVYATKVFAQSIFSFLPKCQYLLASAQHDQPAPDYLAYFSRVYAKPCAECPYDLFLLDKHALNATLTVRPLDWKLDADALQLLLDDSLPNRDRFAENHADHHCFAVVVDYKLVGAVYIEDIEEAEVAQFCTRYDVADVLRDAAENVSALNSAKLEWMVLNPIFARNAKGILKEIMRQIQIDTLFYRYGATADNNEDDDTVPCPPSAVIENFAQFRPKHFVYSKDATESETYALYAFPRGFYALSKEMVNHRVVVIGSHDDAAYGLLEYLITQSDLKFANITLITNDVDKLERGLQEIREGTLLFRAGVVADTANTDYLRKLCVDNKIQIVRDTVAELDAHRKCVHLRDGGCCLYDVLVFANGLGPVHVIPKVKYIQKSAKSKRNMAFSELMEETMRYSNILLASPEVEDHLTRLEAYLQRRDNAHLLGKEAGGNVVIYGDCINMLCIAQHLMDKFKMDGSRLFLVESLSSTSAEFFLRNDTLRAMVMAQLKELGVRWLRNVIPVGFVRSKTDKLLVDAVQFIQNEQREINAMIIDDADEDAESAADVDTEVSPDVIRLRLRTDSRSGLPYYSLDAELVLLCQNEIDIDTLHVTNQHPFVIDGQIVVDGEFKTQDRTIYAIGAIAKFSRKFAPTKDAVFSLQYANAFDVGAQCAALIVNNILEGDVGSDTDEERKAFELDLERETCVMADLPGGFKLFHAYNPRFAMSESARTKAQQLQSFDDKTHQLSAITLDNHGVMREIVYYGREWKAEWVKCGNLVNLHSEFLNKVTTHFTEDEFVNICEVFNKVEFHVLCDDRFKSWMRRLRKATRGQRVSKWFNKDIQSEIEGLIRRIVKGNEE